MEKAGSVRHSHHRLRATLQELFPENGNVCPTRNYGLPTMLGRGLVWAMRPAALACLCRNWRPLDRRFHVARVLRVASAVGAPPDLAAALGVLQKSGCGKIGYATTGDRHRRCPQLCTAVVNACECVLDCKILQVRNPSLRGAARPWHVLGTATC